jgi:hypothetical protein
MVRKYFIAWFGMIILAVANGALRELGYKPHVGDLLAHQISTIILLLLVTIYFWQLNNFWHIESARQSWVIGSMWVLMTVAFEFGVGHFISGASLSKLLYDYNLLAGRVWIFIPLWTFFAPYVFFRFIQSK